MMYTLWKAGGFLLALILVQGCGTEENTESAASLIEADGGALHRDRGLSRGCLCLLKRALPGVGTGNVSRGWTGAPCSFTSSLDGTEYAGLCTFDGRIGDYRCAPELHG